jgi:hypothetical protein
MTDVCSVCGIPYQTRNEYLQHVFSNHTPEEIFDKGHEEGKDSTANYIALGALAVAIGSVIAAGIFSVRTNDYAKEANSYSEQATEYAAQANEYTKQSENRLNWQLSHEYSNKVYLGEAPQYFYDLYPKVGDEITWVVLNSSGVEIHDVWVEGQNDRWIRIQGIQRCTMYSLPLFTSDPDHPEEFEPVAVHFSDPHSVRGNYLWHRATTGELGTDGKPIPTKEEDPDGDDADSPHLMDVEGCSG